MKWTTTEEGYSEASEGEYWFRIMQASENDSKRVLLWHRHFESTEWVNPQSSPNKDAAKKAAKRRAASMAKEDAENAPEPLQEQDPTVTALIEAGYASEAYNLLAMAAIVRQWQADDIDPFDFIDIIASKHQLKESK